MELTNEFHVPVTIARAWAVLTDIELIAPCMPGAQLEEIEGNEYRGGVKVKVGPITAQYKGKATFLEKDDANHRAVIKAEGRDTKGAGNASATITATLTETGSGTDVKVVTDLTITGKVAQFGRGVMADVSAKLLGQFVQCLEHDVLTKPEETIANVAAASAAATTATVAGAAAGVAAGAAVGAAVAGTESAGAAHTSVTPPGSSGAPVAASSVTAPESNGAVVAASNGAASTSTAAASSGASSPASAAAASSSAAASSTGTSSGTAADPAKPGVRKIEYKAAEPVDLLDAAGSPVLKRAAPAAVIGIVLLWLLRRVFR
jgi:uncharacterized protein